MMREVFLRSGGKYDETHCLWEMNEIHDKGYHIATKCKITIEKKPSAAAQWTPPDKLDFNTFFGRVVSSYDPKMLRTHSK